MRNSISLSFLVIVVVLFVMPKTSLTTLAQSDIPMQDIGGDSNDTGTNDTSSNFQTEQMTLKAQFKPSSNQFLGEGYFDIKKFGFIASNGSEICPSNNCKYTVEDGQLSPNSYSGGYTFEGKLKVTTEEGSVKKSKFYNFRVDLDKTSEEERNGQTVQALEGTFGLGKNGFNPEISYEITNATLKVDDKNPVLTIEAERNRF